MRMKQLWALLLALSLLCSLTLPALAEDDEGDEAPALSEDEVSLADLSPIPIEAPPDAEIQASSITINSSNFPDTKFREYLKTTYGRAQTSWFTTTYVLDPDAVDVIDIPGLGISNLSGIEKFPNLTYLNCSGNTGLRSVDIRQSSALMDAVVNWRHVENNGVLSFESKSGTLIMSDYTALTGFHEVTIDFACEGVDPYVLYVEDGELLTWPEGLEEPEREGYWLWDFYVGTPGAYYDWDTPVTQDFTLTAYWVKVWTVTYDFNGGAMNNGATYDSYEIQDGEIPSTNFTLKKEGQIFDCWLLNGEPYEPAPVHSNITLVASWGTPLKLHFDRSNEHDDQHTDIPDILAPELGSSEVSFMYFFGLHSTILSNDGDWQFLGWDTDANTAPDQVAYPRYQNGASNPLTGPYSVRLGEDTTLYPIYGKAPTITVNKNDGMDTDITSDVVRSRGVYSYIMIGKTSYTTLDGYTLLGYSTDHKAEVPDPGLEANSNGNTRQVYYYAAEDLTLYAVWAANSYTVSYDRSGGSGRLPEAISFTLDDKPEIVLPSAEDLGLTKAHRVFLGWSVDASKSDQNCNKVPSGLYAPGDTLDPAVLSAKNHTIYAVWQYEAIKISLDLNGYTGVYTPANGYPMYYNYGWTNGYDVPAGRPVTPLSYPGDKAFPGEYSAAEGETNPFCFWMDKDTGQFYTNGISANRANGTAVLPNDKDTELLGVWKYAFLRYYDANGEVALVDAVVFDADTRTYTRPTVRDAAAVIGCEFLGWATEENGPVVYQPGDTIDSLAEITFYPVYQMNTPSVVLRSVSVVFDGTIRLRYYFTLPEALLDAADSYLVFYKDGQEVKRTALADGTPVTQSEDGSNTSFDFTVMAKEINDEIVIKILDNDGSAYPLMTENGSDYTDSGYAYSARQYADYLTDNSSDPTMRALAKALGGYGDAAAIYFGGAGSVNEDVQAVTLNDFNGYEVKISGVMPAGVTGKSISVLFDSDNSLRIYFSFDAGYSPEDYTFTVDGNAATMQENSSHNYYLTVRNIAAKDLNEAHRFTVSDGEESYTVEASVLSYARLLVAGNKLDSQNLGKALYLYNSAADDHFPPEE